MRGTMFLLVSLILFVGVTPVFAAGGGGEKLHGIMDPHKMILISTWVVFLTAMAILWKFAWGPIIGGIESREKKIRDDLSGAETARQGAEDAQRQVEERLAQASQECEAILTEGRETARVQSEEILAKARLEVEQLKERIDREIDAATKRAYEEVWKSAGSLGVEIASKVLEREIQADDHQKMIDSSVQAFQSSISGQGVS
ncbi:MAG: F0F1 ATP synthase subunit B [Planctomycetota bacterium]|jgi:F-type H+-transporting ATPase subunit b|nr:F0F1 ATP synthase subunit B [Planctomycetota bacterium]